MSHVVVQALMDYAPASLKEGSYSVMLALAEWAHDNGVVEPQFVRRVGLDGQRLEGIPAIAARARISKRQTERVLPELRAKGFLEVKSGRGPGNGNSYRILLDALKKAALDEAKTRHPEPTKPAAITADITDTKPDIGDIKTRRNSGGFKPAAITAHHPSSPSESFMDVKGVEGNLTREETQPTPATILRSVDKGYSARRPAIYSNGAHSPPEEARAIPTRLPSDFAFTPTRKLWAEAQATEHKVRLDAGLSFKKFTNYFRRGNGRETEMDDWEGRWERWFLDDIEKARASPAASTRSRSKAPEAPAPGEIPASWQALAASNPNGHKPPSRPRDSCRFENCTELVDWYPGAKYCRKHGQGPQFKTLNELFQGLGSTK